MGTGKAAKSAGTGASTCLFLENSGASTVTDCSASTYSLTWCSFGVDLPQNDVGMV